VARSAAVMVASVISPPSTVAPMTVAKVMVSLAAVPVIVMPAPSARVKVSVAESATGLVPLGVAIVSKRFWAAPVSSVPQIQAEPLYSMISPE
jgi:hypothetical protein